MIRKQLVVCLFAVCCCCFRPGIGWHCRCDGGLRLAVWNWFYWMQELLPLPPKFPSSRSPQAVGLLPLPSFRLSWWSRLRSKSELPRTGFGCRESLDEFDVAGFWLHDCLLQREADGETSRSEGAELTISVFCNRIDSQLSAPERLILNFRALLLSVTTSRNIIKKFHLNYLIWCYSQIETPAQKCSSLFAETDCNNFYHFSAFKESMPRFNPVMTVISMLPTALQALSTWTKNRVERLCFLERPLVEYRMSFSLNISPKRRQRRRDTSVAGSLLFRRDCGVCAICYATPSSTTCFLTNLHVPRSASGEHFSDRTKKRFLRLFLYIVGEYVGGHGAHSASFLSVQALRLRPINYPNQ